jgi:hypothetical protein
MKAMELVGWAKVYLARDTGLDRTVAVKSCHRIFLQVSN